MTMDKDTVEGEPWPLPTGDYVLYYLLADGYEWVARTEFTCASDQRPGPLTYIARSGGNP